MAPPRINPLFRAWPNSRVLIIGGGPSLTRADVEAARPHHAAGTLKVIGINDAYRICDFCDLLYAADARWWEHHLPRIPKALLKVTCSDTTGKIAADPDIVKLAGQHRNGISQDGRTINYGSHSGHQALNIASLAGAREILLLGYDYQVNGQRHWFGEHPDGVRHANYVMPLDQFARAIAIAAGDLASMGIRVTNCSPGSALTCFDQRPIAEVLDDPAPV